MVQDRHYALAREEILAALTAYTGVTTADGATPVFNTLIDVTLIGKNDFISGKTVLIGSGDALYEDQGAASFDDTTGSITVESPFSAQIKAGTIFRILNAAAGQISELLDALVSYRGTTTADGAIGGGTLVCSDLTTKPDFDGNQAVIKSGPYAGQVRDIDGVTTGGTVTPHTSFGGTITEGTRFSITAIRTVPAEVAAIEAKLDNDVWGLSALAGQSFRPTPHLIETWQTEAIDGAIWGTNLVGTGGAVFSAGEPPYLKVWLSGIANTDEACLYGVHRWFCNPDTAMANYLEKSILRVFHMEFVLRFDDAVILDNTKFFMGLGSIQAAIETTNNIVGFALDASDNLDFLSQNAAAATRAEDVVLLADLADWHKYEIVVSPGEVECFIDEVSGGAITTNLPETAMYPVFHLVQAGAGNPDLHIGVIRIWSEDILR